jgi:hypothetical protein
VIKRAVFHHQHNNVFQAIQTLRHANLAYLSTRIMRPR